MSEHPQEINAAIDKLHEKLERKGKELDILAEIFSQIRSLQDLDLILNRILEQLDHYFNFKHSMILLTSRGNTLKVVASHGYSSKGIGAKVEIGKGIVGTAAKRKQMIRVGNIRFQLRYMSAGENVENPEDGIVVKMPGLQNPESQVAIPLMIQDELIGVLSVESEGINIFKQEDEQIIGLIANQAAIAINNAHLYETEKQRVQEIEDIIKRLSDLTQTQQRTLNLFAKYVPEPVVKQALRGNPESMFDGVQQEVVLLFCDIRDFTPISEKLDPKQVVALLNTFYSGMNDVIKLFGGVINQFVGDEIFVLFGAPVPLVNAEEKAVHCAVGMIAQLEKINAQLQSSLGVSIKIGIGLNLGDVVAGNLGCEDKISYSVTGDSVNTAKRIETLTKEKPNSILISESLYLKTQHLIEANAWEPVAVKGKNDPMRVYEVRSMKS